VGDWGTMQECENGLEKKENGKRPKSLDREKEEKEKPKEVE